MGAMGDGTNAAGELADRFWVGLLEIEPILGTWVGDERYDDRLPDPSEEGLARRKEFFGGALSDLEKIDTAGVDEDLRTTLDILETGSRRELKAIEHRIDRFSVVTHLFGPGNLLAEIASLQRADTPERFERFVGRLSAVPEYLDVTGRVAEEAVKAGQVAPGLVVDRSIGQVERLLALDPSDSPAMGPLEEASAEQRDRVMSVLRDQVWPAYRRYLDVLREYRPAARDTIGLLALPGGDAIYAAQVEGYTSLPLDPNEVHRTGQEELARVLEGRLASARALGYEDVETAVAEYTASGRDTAKSREEMVEVVRGQVERSWEAAPRYFGRLPNANCDVRPVEEFREQDMPGAFYVSPSADGSRAGVYYVCVV
jgi:uncharacterized protein (DUF885 family)